MIKYYTRNINNIITTESGNDFLNENIIWIDLYNPTEDEKKQVEKIFNVELFTKQESEEIETSSRFVESEDEIGINMNFVALKDNISTSDTVSFIIRGKTLITQRIDNYGTFTDVIKKLRILKPQAGDDIFLMLLETRIDYDADLIEKITDIITSIGAEMIKDKQLEKDLLLRITSLQETTIAVRENIVEKQRILSALLKSKFFPSEDYEKMRIMIKDVGSLLDHTSFNFERLEFIQNTFLGLVDIEQNRIIKIFTVVTVIFMPPTLIASLYGMNFKYMPELSQVWGYPLALLLMLFSSASTLLFFKKKNWL